MHGVRAALPSSYIINSRNWKIGGGWAELGAKVEYPHPEGPVAQSYDFSRGG